MLEVTGADLTALKIDVGLKLSANYVDDQLSRNTILRARLDISTHLGRRPFRANRLCERIERVGRSYGVRLERYADTSCCKRDCVD